MSRRISVIIPNRNGRKTIKKCLEAVFASRYDNFEVIVVDDASEDNSVEIIKRFPCKLIRLPGGSGASNARNIGARSGRGEILFFTDSDCLLKRDTLDIVAGTFEEKGSNTVIGGTYTRIPHDKSFFSVFQSVFVNYSETKKAGDPDYVAAHAMALDAEIFSKSGGFPSGFLPIIEDVEFSHRLRRAGHGLFINPDIEVRHIFGFSLLRSLRNAFRKTMYWAVYSLINRDVFADSGSASIELKINVLTYFLSSVFIISWVLLQNYLFLYPSAFFVVYNFLINRRLLKAFYEAKGMLFAVLSSVYYFFVYPLPVGLGGFAGMMSYFMKYKSGGIKRA